MLLVHAADARLPARAAGRPIVRQFQPSWGPKLTNDPEARDG
jgi:hypothetical protein